MQFYKSKYIKTSVRQFTFFEFNLMRQKSSEREAFANRLQAVAEWR